MSDSSTPANGSVGDGARTKGFRFGTGMFLLGATLSLGGIAASQAIAKALVAMRHESSIRVKGYAEEAIESDQGTWTGRVQVTAKTLPEAYRKLEEHMATFAAFVVRSGFPDTSLTISAVESQPVFRRDERGNPTTVVEHYQLAQSITVTGHEPKLIERVSRDATSLIKEGIDLASLQPIFVNTQIESIKMRLLAAATDNTLKPQPTVTAITSKVGSDKWSTGNHAPSSTSVMPKRITRGAPARSTQRPIVSDVSTTPLPMPVMSRTTLCCLIEPSG